MEGFRPYSPEDAVFANLEELNQRQYNLFRQAKAHLRELAYQTVSEFESSDALLAALPDLHLHALFPGSRNAGDSDRLSESDRMLNHLSEQSGTYLQILYAGELKKCLPIADADFFPLFFPAGEDEVPLQKISYSKNDFTDSAFGVFAKAIPNVQPVATHSFKAACDEVEKGTVQGVILPLEGVSGKRLESFAELIRSHDLKILAVTDVENQEGKITRFALLQKRMGYIPIPAEPYLFEIRAELSPEKSPESILRAASFCGMSCRGAEISPIGDALSGNCGFHGIWQTQNGSFSTFLFFLAMEIPDYLPLGYYPVLK